MATPPKPEHSARRSDTKGDSKMEPAASKWKKVQTAEGWKRSVQELSKNKPKA